MSDLAEFKKNKCSEEVSKNAKKKKKGQVQEQLVVVKGYTSIITK